MYLTYASTCLSWSSKCECQVYVCVCVRVCVCVASSLIVYVPTWGVWFPHILYFYPNAHQMRGCQIIAGWFNSRNLPISLFVSPVGWSGWGVGGGASPTTTPTLLLSALLGTLRSVDAAPSAALFPISVYIYPILLASFLSYYLSISFNNVTPRWECK